MDKKFKWNMFITSFIPLWLSIMVSDIWNIAESGIKTWRHCDSICTVSYTHLTMPTKLEV